MKKNILNLKNLDVSINTNNILLDVNTSINEGDCVVILGPNGEGKSTLLKTIMGLNMIEIKSGIIDYYNENINNLPIDERSKKGIFLINQNPIEIEGITQIDFYKAILKAHNKKVNLVTFYNEIQKKLSDLNLNNDILERFLNVDFSGGEKKKNEIIQMLLCDPKLILIDEIDSGLDVDAIKNIASILKKQLELNKTIIFITHNKELIELLKPNKTLLIANKTIAHEGDYDFAIKTLNVGFNKIFNELNINKPKQEQLEVCAGNKNGK